MNIVSMSMDSWIQEGWRGSRQCLSEAFSRHCGVNYFWIGRINEWKFSLGQFRPRMMGNKLLLYQSPIIIPRVPWRPKLNKIWDRLRLEAFRRALSDVWTGPRILYVWHPSMLPYVGKMGEDIVCYHMYDNIIGFLGDKTTRKDVVDAERLLIDRADIIISASRKLSELHGVADRAILCHAGVDQLFLMLLKQKLLRPVDMPVSGPIVGFYGTLNSKFGAEDVLALSEARPDLNIVLIGNLQIPAERADQFEQLFRKENVYVLGPKSWEEIPAYLQCFDVALMSYYPTEWSVYCEVPLKAYEYLAAGKPVVASGGLPSLLDLEGLIYLTHSQEEFVHAVGKALEDSGDEIVEKRIKEALRNTWDVRAKMILDIIQKQLRIKKNSALPVSTLGV